MLNQLEANRNHRLFHNNLITSVKFSRGTEKRSPKALSLGVSRSSGRGVPPALFQIQENIQRRKEEIVGTLKAAVIKDN